MSEFPVAEATIAALAEAMASGQVTSEQLTMAYLERIAAYDKAGPRLNAVLAVNPDALFIARALDRERQANGPRGPLHGIPVLIKGNIDTHDKMPTSAGTLALAGSYAPQDAFLVSQLRAAGAVILGKANLTELANFMTEGMPNGYSSHGGQVLNPYGPGRWDPSGSSSGPAAAVAASLCGAAVGTETDGSILSPASHCSVVGIKPTVGLISRSGIVPIAFSQDTAGPMARTVADAAALLGAMAGEDPADPATLAGAGFTQRDYTAVLDRAGLRGARIGVPRAPYAERPGAAERPLFEAALAALRDQGAEVVDPADIAPETAQAEWDPTVLLYEFKAAMNAYLAALGPAAPVRSLREMVEFNLRFAGAALKYGQAWLIKAEATSGTLTEPEYLQARLRDIRQSCTLGIDTTMDRHRLDALLFPTSEGSTIGAQAGYPSVCVPAGYTAEGHPVGIMFLGRAWSEPALIRMAYAYEQATAHRRPPPLE